MIPWKEVSAAIVKVFTLTQEMQANKADIKRLSEKVDGLSKEVQSLNQKTNDLAFALQRAYYENQRSQDELRHLREDNERRDKDAARERENLILRLENQRFRVDRILPPPDAGTPGE